MLEIKIIISHLPVTSHLSSAGLLYMHDGAVGSSPHVDVKVCTIPDNSSAALILSIIVNPALTRVASHDVFPLTVYVASNYRLALKYCLSYAAVNISKMLSAKVFSLCIARA
jgi:hypothetical protein